MFGAQNAYDQVYDDQRPRHEITHELLAGFAAAEVDKHFERGHYGHLDRREARRLAEDQAYHLWDQQYGRY